MARYGFVYDIERCNGCFACFLACKDEYTGNDHMPLSAATIAGENLMRVNEIEYGTDNKVKVDYVPIACQHCKEPPCASKFPDAFYTRPDGLVILDPKKADNKAIVGSCPYGAIAWNEQSGIAQKCNGCAHMLDAGETTSRCAECCPNQALFFGDLDDPNSEISKFIAEKGGELEELKPEYGCSPVARYLNLPKPFICGEVLRGEDGSCLGGATVTCTCQESGKVTQTVSDFLGDFEFRFLGTNKPYTIKVTADGYKPAVLEARTMASVNLGEIALEKI